MSGIGRTGSRYGLLNYVDIKGIHIDMPGTKEEDWWYLYSENKMDYFMDIISGYQGESALDKGRTKLKLARGFRGNNDS